MLGYILDNYLIVKSSLFTQLEIPRWTAYKYLHVVYNSTQIIKRWKTSSKHQTSGTRNKELYDTYCIIIAVICGYSK